MGRTTTGLAVLHLHVFIINIYVGPGPGKYILPSLVGYANHDPSRYRNPQYSIGLKVQKTKKDLGPGPKYNTEHMTSHGKANPPAYSIASRHGISSTVFIPKTFAYYDWLNIFCLETFQSPSPANYDLQNAPRIKEPRPPAYSMTSRHYTGTTFQTPGPNNYEIPTTLGPKVPDKPANGAFSMLVLKLYVQTVDLKTITQYPL